MKGPVTCYGRVRMCLSVGGKLHFEYLARMVAKAFIPNPDGKPEVNHIDGDKLNNHVSNLEWVTNLENNHHATVNGLRPSGDRHWLRRNPERIRRGEDNNKAKLTEADVRAIRQMFLSGMTDPQVAAAYPFMTKDAIRHVRIRKTWKHVE